VSSILYSYRCEVVATIKTLSSYSDTKIKHVLHSQTVTNTISFHTYLLFFAKHSGRFILPRFTFLGYHVHIQTYMQERAICYCIVDVFKPYSYQP